VAKFLLIFRGGAASLDPPLSPTELQAHLQKWGTWMKGLREAGQIVGGQPLRRDGKSLRGRDKVVTDGPFAESKDLVTGTLVIEAPAIDAAVELSRACPIFEIDGSVEVRVVFDQP
jgi:hypothetical protein